MVNITSGITTTNMFAIIFPSLLISFAFVHSNPISASNKVGDWNSVHNDLEEIERALLKLGTKTSDGVLIPNASMNNFINHKKPRVRKIKTKHVHKPAEQEGLEFESDMSLSPEEKEDLQEMESRGRFRRKAVANEMKLWPNGVVYYELSSGLDQQAITNIKSAMKLWEDATCLRFREYRRQSGSSDRIIFVRSQGCQSPIGRRGGPQEIMIGEYCKESVGSIAHEIAHSFGFYHEHSRPDRDEHVTIYKNNIKQGFEMDFQKFGVRSIEDIEPYDVSSVMHYGPTYMSKDGQSKTIVPRIKNLMNTMGQRNVLSFLDIKTANDLYKCAASCPVQLNCKNKGYVGPNCACLCPQGLTGRDCSEVVQSNTNCGGELTETSGTFTSPNYPGDYSPYAECMWVIKGPPGSRISLTIEDFRVEDDATCYFDWLEVFLGGPHIGGARFCGERQGGVNMPPRTMEYPGNTLLVRLHADDSNEYTGFRARYTIHT
ncbi:blastula protease 10-like [Ostrea edulis]|uniref:blastula protease 10-like n=1 Tax=Ostrea edulis TaxID=37623 RepID=UPI0024AF70A5|nr:blastula protease 10-like [Ostrea edulis]